MELKREESASVVEEQRWCKSLEALMIKWLEFQRAGFGRLSVSLQGAVKTWTYWITHQSWWWNISDLPSLNDEWMDFPSTNMCTRLFMLPLYLIIHEDSAKIWPQSSSVPVWKQDVILQTDKVCRAWRRSRKQQIHIFLYTNSCWILSVSLLQRRSHIKILVSARRQWRRCCLFAEQLPLTETLILPSLHPPPPPNLWKKRLYMTEGRKKPSLHILHNRSNGFMWQKHSSLHPPQSSRKKRQSISRHAGELPERRIWSLHKWCNLARADQCALFLHLAITSAWKS